MVPVAGNSAGRKRVWQPAHRDRNCTAAMLVVSSLRDTRFAVGALAGPIGPAAVLLRRPDPGARAALDLRRSRPGGPIGVRCLARPCRGQPPARRTPSPARPPRRDPARAPVGRRRLGRRTGLAAPLPRSHECHADRWDRPRVMGPPRPARSPAGMPPATCPVAGYRCATGSTSARHGRAGGPRAASGGDRTAPAAAG